MKNHALALTVATAALLSLGACNKNDGGNNSAPNAQTPKAEQAAGNKTIASGLDQNSKFMAAAKAAGLDQTLAGPGRTPSSFPPMWRSPRPPLARSTRRRAIARS